MSSGLIPGVSQDRLVRSAFSARTDGHLVHFYDEDADLLASLTDYVKTAWQSGGCALVIGTPEHLDSLQKRLLAEQIDLARAVLDDRYIRLDAETALARFMVGGWPDEASFREFLERPLRRAAVQGRRVFAFGEMAALLWERGDTAAAIEVERMWNEVLRERSISLLCAFPRRVLGDDPAAAVNMICACHSGVSDKEGSKVA